MKEEPVTDAAVDVNDGSAEEKVSEPKVQKPAEKAAPEPEPEPEPKPEPEPEPEPEKADAKPSSSDELGPKDGKAEDRRGPDDAQPVGVEASTSRSTTAKPEVEEKPHAEPVVTASVQAPAEPSQEEKPKPDEVAASPAAAKRPKFLDGDVPIYDEEYFYSELKRELSKCRRVDRPLTLILIQVGDLAQIVELFGQETREAVLWHVAEQATAALREVDLVGMMLSKELIALAAFASDRYGGGRVVARIRKLLEQNPFRVGEELPPIVPALQFGLSSFPDDGDEVVALIAKASDDIEP